MLAEKDEITAALSEGVEIINGFSSLSAEKKDGKVRSIQGVLIRSFKFGPNGLEIDAISGSEQSLETDTLIIAIGQRIGLEESFGVKLGRGGSVAVDSSMSSSVPGIFAGGDAVTGTLSVVEAIASGRKAASSIDLFLGGDGVIDEEYCDPVEPSSNIGNQEFSMQPRSECFGGCNEALAQSQRCLQCDLRLKISKVKMWTDPSFKKAKREAGA
jgi:NADPH-dependent glutamate synthase beta subunit-like oxidoreductase